MAEPYLDRIAGVGLDSSELGHPPSKFQTVFKAARERGLKLVAHAGEEGPPQYVWEALDLLKIDRLDHGNRALEQGALVERLVAGANSECTRLLSLSNLKLCVVPSLEDHPLKRMLALGLCATINSDDPAYFGGYLNDNYNAVARGRPDTRGTGDAREEQLPGLVPGCDRQGAPRRGRRCLCQGLRRPKAVTCADRHSIV